MLAAPLALPAETTPTEFQVALAGPVALPSLRRQGQISIEPRRRWIYLYSNIMVTNPNTQASGSARVGPFWLASLQAGRRRALARLMDGTAGLAGRRAATNFESTFNRSTWSRTSASAARQPPRSLIREAGARGVALLFARRSSKLARRSRHSSIKLGPH